MSCVLNFELKNLNLNKTMTQAKKQYLMRSQITGLLIIPIQPK